MKRWMREAVRLPEEKAWAQGGKRSVRRRWVVLVNPFYPKDERASFGKHVLTPTLALSTVAGATPPGWEVELWDENLLEGLPPGMRRKDGELPEVVGITVHLTTAQRAYALADWYRAHGSVVVLGGLHAMSCPDEVRRHADAVAVGDGSVLWPTILEEVAYERVARQAGKTRKAGGTGRGETAADWEGVRREAAMAATRGPGGLENEKGAIAGARGSDNAPGTGDARGLKGDCESERDEGEGGADGGGRIYRAEFVRPYREEPAPRRALLDRRSFLTTSSLMATRGCHNRCGFCYLSTRGVVMPYQMRDPAQVAAEFAADGQPYGVFLDNNLGSKPAYLRTLCAALAPLKKIWSAAVTIDVTDDPALVEAMARSGCTGVFVGLETVNDAALKAAGKRTPQVADYGRRVQIFHKAGIQVNGSFVLGFDQDGPDVFARTVEWIEAQRLECATFHLLTPYPGTPLFAQMEREGRLLHRDWTRYDTAHVVFRPKQMTPEELEAGYAWCYRRLFTWGSIWRRRPAEWRALAAYLGMACLYKKSNWLWPWLIKHRLTGPVWRGLVEMARKGKKR